MLHGSRLIVHGLARPKPGHGQRGFARFLLVLGLSQEVPDKNLACYLVQANPGQCHGRHVMSKWGLLKHDRQCIIKTWPHDTHMKAIESLVSPVKSASDDDDRSAGGGESALADPLRKNLKLRSRRLRAFIASFAGGKVPPIRSYRSLIFIEEFGEYITKMENVFTPVPYQNWNIHCYPPPSC